MLKLSLRVKCKEEDVWVMNESNEHECIKPIFFKNLKREKYQRSMEYKIDLLLFVSL